MVTSHITTAAFKSCGRQLIGFVSRLQGLKVVEEDDRLFRDLFTPILCLFLLVLDLSTASFCTAGTFPGGADSIGAVLSAIVLAHVEGPLNAEDDGCFCCCTHILPGAHFDLAALEPMIVAASVPGVLDPSGSPLKS